MHAYQSSESDAIDRHLKCEHFEMIFFGGIRHAELYSNVYHISLDLTYAEKVEGDEEEVQNDSEESPELGVTRSRLIPFEDPEEINYEPESPALADMSDDSLSPTSPAFFANRRLFAYVNGSTISKVPTAVPSYPKLV